jgi:hypothetical protein
MRAQFNLDRDIGRVDLWIPAQLGLDVALDSLVASH